MPIGGARARGGGSGRGSYRRNCHHNKLQDVFASNGLHLEDSTRWGVRMQFLDEFRAEVLAQAEELGQPLPSTTELREVDMCSIFLDVVDISQKRLIFGLGRSKSTTTISSTPLPQYDAQSAISE
ncbi:hypothetical protein C2S52_001527 [Perilla frutescens var. hirtella]|nr:hypothetical protein C2S52_001527 [Perilla frutescens var. hirtella]